MTPKKKGQGQNRKDSSQGAPETPKRRRRGNPRTKAVTTGAITERQKKKMSDKKAMEIEQREEANHPTFSEFAVAPDPDSTLENSDSDDEQQPLSAKTFYNMEANYKADDNSSEDSEAETEAVDNTHGEEQEWIQVTYTRRSRNPYNQVHVAKDLKAPVERISSTSEGKKYTDQWRSNFCITVEPAATQEEMEENVDKAMQQLFTVLVNAGAEILPWKEEKYDKKKVVTKATLNQVLVMPYKEKKGLYIDSAIFYPQFRKVYPYLYLGLPRRYSKFRGKVEQTLKEIDAVWYVNTMQAETRYPLGFVLGSHKRADPKRIQEIIKQKTNIDVVARYRMWTLPKEYRPVGVEDDRVFAIHLETDARYDAPDRRLIYRMFGSDPEHRKSVELAIESTLETILVPAKLNGLNDKALEGSTTARIIQRNINSKLREKTMFNTIEGSINKPLTGHNQLALRDLLMITKQQHFPKRSLFVSVDQQAGCDSPTLTFIDGLQGEVDRFIEGARIIMEANAKRFFNLDICLESTFTTSANKNYTEQEFDPETGRYTSVEEQFLMTLGQRFEIDWTEFVGNAVDPSKWVLEEPLDDQSMASRLSNGSYATQNTNETMYPDEDAFQLTDGTIAFKPFEQEQYTAADDRDSGTSAMDN
jgi:hypothetical protein